MVPGERCAKFPSEKAMGQWRACGADDIRGAQARMGMGPDDLLQGMEAGAASRHRLAEQRLGPPRQLGHT